jgi:stringent starvation protein B
MISKLPYLLRALHEWISDNSQTPLIVVDSFYEGLQAPSEHAESGKLILNVSYSATNELQIGNEAIIFKARFNGRPMDLYIPIEAVLGIYARESGEGMVFALTEDESEASGVKGPANSDSQIKSNSKTSRPSAPTLKVVK